VATSASTLRPNSLARTAKRRLVVIENYSTMPELLPQNSVLLSQILDHLLLVVLRRNLCSDVF
jgi:hypothetical protein